jgi:hypothetical protein
MKYFLVYVDEERKDTLSNLLGGVETLETLKIQDNNEGTGNCWKTLELEALDEEDVIRQVKTSEFFNEGDTIREIQDITKSHYDNKRDEAIAREESSNG